MNNSLALARDEPACLRAERYYRILDTPNENIFDRFCEFAAQLFGVPGVAIGFADCDRISFKATYGLELSQVDREDPVFARALDSETVVQATDPLLQEAKPRAGDAGWCFVAGVAIRCPGGHAFGGIWLVDKRLRRLSSEEELSLQALSKMVIDLLELRRNAVPEISDDRSERHWTRESKDPVTGLPTRNAFVAELGRALAQTPHLASAVLLVGIDRFGVINDSFGRKAGDQLLFSIAERLRGCLPDDNVARLGRDQFGVLLKSGGDACRTSRVATRIQRVFRQPLELINNEVVASISVGIAVSNRNDEEPRELLRNAELAMHQSRARKSGRYVVFDPDMRARAQARLQTESELRMALEQGELELHYQPIVELASASVSGLEALLRWRHPTRGLLAPSEFLHIAEETGLIIPIGSWVLYEACRQANSWNHLTDRPTAVSVNLSALQLAETDLPATVAGALEETKLPSELLWLEVTESLLLDDIAGTAVVLNTLRTLGIQVCLDDFGSGYSSMAYLAQLPVDILKIDRRFIRGLETAENREIVRTIISLGRSLDLGIVLEGVERRHQLAEVRALGCDYVQGYFLAPPLAAREVIPILTGELLGNLATPLARGFEQKNTSIEPSSFTARWSSSQRCRVER